MLALLLNVFALFVCSVWSVGGGYCQSSLLYALLQEALPASSMVDGRLLPVHQSPAGWHCDVPTYLRTYIHCISLVHETNAILQQFHSAWAGVYTLIRTAFLNTEAFGESSVFS